MLNATTAVESLSWCIPKPAVRKQSLNRGDLVAQRGVSPRHILAPLGALLAAAVDEDGWEGVVGTLMPPPGCNLRSIVP